MTIQIGDRLPNVTLGTAANGEIGETATDAVFAGKKVVLFAVPGAFTPTCSRSHLPGYMAHYDALRAAGVDAVACLSVNDAFVMAAWGKSQNAGDIVLLADGSGAFTEAVGLELDLTDKHFGVRSQRYALYAEDGVVRQLQVEAGGELKVSTAENMLRLL